MNHSERAFSFKEIKSQDDLVDAIFNHRWPLCYSFYHKKLLYLNDGDSEDLPEFAVVAIDGTEGRFGIHGREVGRIRPISMPAGDAPGWIQKMNSSYYTGGDPVRFNAEPKWHHHCPLCGMEEDL
jgi:hypothetical protein